MAKKIRVDIMPEIRFSIKKELNDKILKLCAEIGCRKADYLRYLIINDLKK